VVLLPLSGQKLALGILAIITLEVVPFQALLPFLTASWKSCPMRVFSTIYLHFCLYHLNCVKIAAFQFYLQLRRQKK
jgi:hypothetical protein